MNSAIAVMGYRRSDIEARLQPGTADEVLDAVMILAEQWPNVRDGDHRMRIRGYVMALQRYGLATVKACVAAAIDGRLGNPSFMPLAPEMAAWCRSHERMDREELARLERNSAVRIDGPDERVRRRVGDGLKSLSEALAKSSIGDKLPADRIMRSPTAGKENSDGNRDRDPGSGRRETTVEGREP